RAVAFSPDGQQVFLVHDGMNVLWDLGTGRQVQALPGYVDRAAFSPDGKHLLTLEGNGKATRWEARTGRRLRVVQAPGLTGGGGALGIDPDGRPALSVSEDQKAAILWDAQTGQQRRTYRGHAEDVQAVAFSPDGRQVLTASRDRTAILWDTETGE